MPVFLAAVIILIAAFGNYIPTSAAEILYGLSLAIKSIIIFLLPAVIFCLLFNSTVNLAGDASKIIILIFVSVIFSNFISTTVGQLIGIMIHNQDLSITMPEENNVLQGKILFSMPSVIANHYAMFSGIIIGIIIANINPSFSRKLTEIFEIIINKLLKFITALIPLFITGFIVKMKFDGIINQLFKDYSLIFFIIALSQISYVSVLYFVVEKFNFSRTIHSIKNMIPAALSGFSTMSSAASMPLTIAAVSKNAANKNLVQTLVPATVNIHLIGDCIAIPCFAFAILKNFGLGIPEFYTCLIFTFFFVIAKFSVAAVPGGGIIVMLPILEQYLGFNTEMLSLITALYILFDPVITCCNVLGNGAFAKIIDKIVSLTLSLKQNAVRT